MAGSHSTFPLPLKDNVKFVPDIEEWEDYKRWYHETKPGQFIFGGLPSSEYDLESTFDRAYKKNRLISTGIPKWRYEAVMLLNFKRIAHQYIEASNIPQENDILEWLSLLRHYGAPSRLLDFSYSFYIAAYFAIEGAGIIKDLNQMNINWETLYGDLEGVARSLNDFFCLDYRLNTNEELLYRAIGLDLATL